MPIDFKDSNISYLAVLVLRTKLKCVCQLILMRSYTVENACGTKFLTASQIY